ncbi:unnamed protein product [Amoebophrya sp. A25]|nr:unnamed protein product [Amoebophrya sp. A25]|eukprot:GSA25T00008768001.1
MLKIRSPGACVLLATRSGTAKSMSSAAPSAPASSSTSFVFLPDEESAARQRDSGINNVDEWLRGSIASLDSWLKKTTQELRDGALQRKSVRSSEIDHDLGKKVATLEAAHARKVEALRKTLEERGRAYLGEGFRLKIPAVAKQEQEVDAKNDDQAVNPPGGGATPSPSRGTTSKPDRVVDGRGGSPSSSSSSSPLKRAVDAKPPIDNQVVDKFLSALHALLTDEKKALTVGHSLFSSFGNGISLRQPSIEEHQQGACATSIVSVLRKFFSDVLQSCCTMLLSSSSSKNSMIQEQQVIAPIEDVISCHLESIRRVLRPTFEAAARDPHLTTEELVNTFPEKTSSSSTSLSWSQFRSFWRNVVHAVYMDLNRRRMMEIRGHEAVDAGDDATTKRKTLEQTSDRNVKKETASGQPPEPLALSLPTKEVREQSPPKKTSSPPPSGGGANANAISAAELEASIILLDELSPIARVPDQTASASSTISANSTSANVLPDPVAAAAKATKKRLLSRSPTFSTSTSSAVSLPPDGGVAATATSSSIAPVIAVEPSMPASSSLTSSRTKPAKLYESGPPAKPVVGLGLSSEDSPIKEALASSSSSRIILEARATNALPPSRILAMSKQDPTSTSSTPSSPSRGAQKSPKLAGSSAVRKIPKSSSTSDVTLLDKIRELQQVREAFFQKDELVVGKGDGTRSTRDPRQAPAPDDSPVPRFGLPERQTEKTAQSSSARSTPAAGAAPAIVPVKRILGAGTTSGASTPLQYINNNDIREVEKNKKEDLKAKFSNQGTLFLGSNLDETEMTIKRQWEELDHLLFGVNAPVQLGADRRRQQISCRDLQRTQEKKKNPPDKTLMSISTLTGTANATSTTSTSNTAKKKKANTTSTSCPLRRNSSIQSPPSSPLSKSRQDWDRDLEDFQLSPEALVDVEKEIAQRHAEVKKVGENRAEDLFEATSTAKKKLAQRLLLDIEKEWENEVLRKRDADVDISFYRSPTDDGEMEDDDEQIVDL